MLTAVLAWLIVSGIAVALLFVEPAPPLAKVVIWLPLWLGSLVALLIIGPVIMLAWPVSALWRRL